MSDLNRFVSFEGLDFSGKSTQIKLLTSKLEQAGQNVLLLREPGGTQISEKIRTILLDKKHMGMTDVCEVLLYSAARHQLLAEKIIPEIAFGNFVVADRYVDSTTAYQGYGRQIPMAFIRELNKIATKDTMPAVTFYLDIDLETLKLRRNDRASETDRLENQDDSFYERIRQGYLDIAKLNSGRIIMLDGNLSVEVLQKKIWEFVQRKFYL